MTTLDFENLEHTALLSTQYASLGATFTDADTAAAKRPGVGFNFVNYPPRSGDTLITSKFTGLIDVAFSHDVSEVSLWFVSRATFGGKLLAYDATGGLLTSFQLTGIDPNYRQIAVSVGGIRKITFQAPAGFAVMDDLSFTAAPVPEPASLAALALGGAAFVRRRRRG